MNSVPFSKSHCFVLLLVVLSVVFLNTAWVAEDAFITFRAVDNLLNGYGPVWNIGERVQVYTHPLWYFLLCGGTALFTHSYWVAIGLSYLCLVGVIVLFVHIAYQHNRSMLATNVLLVFAALPLSRAFMDYSSSGLENPLVHLLLVSYATIIISQHLSLAKKYVLTSFLYGLIFLTRPDAIFLITPASLYLFFQMVTSKQRWLSFSLFAISPVLCWEAFSLIYYGSFVPNTALAKVNIDFERADLIKNAYYYFAFNIKNDPITALIILLAIILPWFNKAVICRIFSMGILLQLLYITYVGADYMLGRFLSPSFVLSAITLIALPWLATSKKKAHTYLGVTLLLLVLPFQVPYTLQYSGNFLNMRINQRGIADERGFYFQHLGMLPVLIKRKGNYGTYSWVILGHYLKNNSNVQIGCAIGMVGWSGGDKPYWVDPYALAEPFLARLPAKRDARPGHYERAFPMGYFKTLFTQENHIQDKTLAALYDDVKFVVTGELWSKQRWQAIYRLNTGYYQDLDQHFNRDATGLMELGIAANSRDKLSCAGLAAPWGLVSTKQDENGMITLEYIR